MVVAKREPEPAMTRRRSNNRPHIRRTGTQAKPGRVVQPPAEAEDGSGNVLRPTQLNARRRRLTSGDLDAGRQPQASLHGCDHIAFLRVDKRHGEHRPGGLVMHVITALRPQRYAITERCENLVGPRSEGYYNLPCADHAL